MLFYVGLAVPSSVFSIARVPGTSWFQVILLFSLRLRSFSPPRALLWVGVLTALVCRPATAAAHEIPTNVTVQAYVKPEGRTLRFVVRVPLSSMRDMDLRVRGPGYVVPSEADAAIRDAAQVWIAGYLSIFENGRRLEGERIVAARIGVPSDRSFSNYQDALASAQAPRLPDNLDLIWDQALLDVLIEYPIESETSAFSIEPHLAHLGIRTNTILRFLPPDASERVFQYTGDPGLVRLDPRWHQASLTFVKLGFEHILEGFDHLLFIFCLVIPLRRIRPLIAVVTSFTVAHSITLIAAAFGFAPSALWFPALIETLIALSIVYMAFENIVGANVERRWMVAFGFGLIHGFGFSFLLMESLQFAGSHLVASLLAFNVGVELGQILVLLIAIPLLNLLFHSSVPERTGVILLSALVAHSAWHWMTDRGTELMEYQFVAPTLDAAFAALAMRWMMLALVAGAVAWGMYELFGRLIRPAGGEGRPRAQE